MSAINSTNAMQSNLGMLAFQTLGAVQVAGMRAEVRLFPQLPGGRHIWTAPSNILTFRFAPTNACWTRSASDPKKFFAAGPLTFRPSSASWETQSNGAPTLSVMAVLDGPLPPLTKYEAGPCSIDDFSMIEMMCLLHDEIRTPGFASTAMVESIGELLRIKLCRLRKTSDDKSSSRRPSLGRGDIALIHDYIEAQAGASPSVTELAQLFHMSRRSLLRRFKNATSMTITDYITEVQVSKAKRLLANSDVFIKRVAHETGFKSASNFTIAFERRVGVTPSAFRSLSRGSSRGSGT